MPTCFRRRRLVGTSSASVRPSFSACPDHAVAGPTRRTKRCAALLGKRVGLDLLEPHRLRGLRGPCIQETTSVPRPIGRESRDLRHCVLIDHASNGPPDDDHADASIIDKRADRETMAARRFVVTMNVRHHFVCLLQRQRFCFHPSVPVTRRRGAPPRRMAIASSRRSRWGSGSCAIACTMIPSSCSSDIVSSGRLAFSIAASRSTRV